MFHDFYRRKTSTHSFSERIINAVIAELKCNPLLVRKHIDLGVGTGQIAESIATPLAVREVYGVDISEEALKVASERGIRVHKADLNVDKLPFVNDYFGLVTAFELIEHLVDPDHMLAEAYRVLRPSGIFVISTPNMVSWLNRISVLLGHLPRYYEVSLNYVVDGLLEREPRTALMCGHIRLSTPLALKNLLLLHGFKPYKVVGISGPIQSNGKREHKNLYTLHNALDSVFSKIPSLSSGFIIFSRK